MTKYKHILTFALACALALPGERVKAGTPKTDAFRQGLVLYEAGIYERARSLFEESCPKGGDAVAEGYAALCALKLRSSDCDRVCEEYLAKYPSSALNWDVRFENALILFDDGAYEAALKELTAIDEERIEKDRLPEYVFKTGYCYYATGDRKSAKNYFDSLGKMPMSDYTAPARYLLGYMAYTEKDFDTASKYLSLSARDARFENLSKFFLVDCAFMGKDYDAVIAEGESIFDAVPDSRKEHLARIISESFLVKGDAASAKRYYELGSKKSKSRSDHFYSGSLLYAVGDWEGAIESYLKMEDRTDSLGQIASYQMGYSYIQTGNKVAALEAFKSASLRDYDYRIQEDAFFNYAKLAFDLNGDTSAFSSYLKNYSTLSKGEQIYNYIALAALHDRDYAAAVEAYGNIETLDSAQKLNYAKANYLRASQLAANLSWRDAAPYFKSASYYMPSRDKFGQLSRYWYAESLYRSGNWKEASGVYADLYNISALDDCAEGRLLPYNIASCNYRQKGWTAAAKWYDVYISSGDAFCREDALTRRADCDFVRRNYRAAAQSYRKVIDEFGSSDKIYPRLQQAVSLGLTGKRDEKLAILEEVKDAPADAPLYSEAMCELGSTYLDSGNYEGALSTFRQLRRTASDSVFVAKALIGLGMTSRNMSDYGNALESYERVVDMLPGSEYADDALLAIESIYQTCKTPEKYLEYVEAKGIVAAKSEADRENLYYNTAEQVYLAGNWAQAVSSAKKYLEKYPSGEGAPRVLFYMAEAEKNLSEKESACADYMAAVKAGAKDSYLEMALLGYANLSFELERFEDAWNGYEQLSRCAAFEENRSAATLGRMRSAFAGKVWAEAVDAAAGVAADGASTPDLLREAKYVRAKSLLALSRRPEAFTVLNDLATEPSTAEGAEARYLLILGTFDRGEFDAVETLVYDFASCCGNQSYWLAKSFIVLGDAFLEKGNAAQAKATWESVRDGYEPAGADDDIPQTVKTKLDKIQQ